MDEYTKDSIWVVVGMFGLFVAGSFALRWSGILEGTQFDYQLNGSVTQPVLESPEFVIRIWHQHPGKLEGGKLTVNVNGHRIATDQHSETKHYSFETWLPNESQAAEFRFRLRNHDDSTPLHVQLTFRCGGVNDHQSKTTWQNGNWK